MKTASCPSCGAPVVFKSAASVYAVCEFCRSTLLRDGETLKDLGRMAELMDDPSLIRIGSEGRYKGIHFGVIGRIQLKYEQGLWNEWHILFDDGRNAWLSEAGGEYVVSAQRPSAANLPAFASLKPDMPVLIDGQRFAVTNLTTARCIAGQGELPFKVESGYDVNTADLRDGQKFATIDYSETPPLLFVGSPAKFDELNLTNLNEAPGDSSSSPGGARVKAEAFNCPSCAAPLTIHSLAIQRIGCPGCGSMIGVENAKVRLLAEAAQKLRIQPWLPLGSKGRLANIDWEAIGFMERYSTSEGVNYFWREYLLFNAKEGFAWLTEYDGHWNFVRTLSDPPWSGKRKLRFVYGEESFRHFSSSRAKVSYVIGEFYWRVKVGESCAVEDYICPPKILSREISATEVSWSEGSYLEPEAVRTAFGIAAAVPRRVGVYANQPNPLAGGRKKIFRLYWVMLLLATLMQIAFVLMFPASSVLRQQFTLSANTGSAGIAGIVGVVGQGASSAGGTESLLKSQEFVLATPARALRVKHSTNIDNNWVGIANTLVEKNTGAVYQGMQEIGYYHGVDDEGRWSEGSRSDSILFKRIPAGTYYLNIGFELGSDGRRVANYAVADTVEITRNPTGWLNYILLVLFLTAFPLYAFWRYASFEARRWAESDWLEGDST